ncbi:MAG: ribokinase [Phycisphaeraceae bacterium]|nr:ribokinase [Phycisphaeraceae bacterium]
METPDRWDLVALGLVAVDVLIRLPEQVRHDDKQFVDDLTIQGGAPVGSASCGVARLGFRAAVAARLGHNTLSAIARQQFADSHVALDLVVEDQDSRPAIALVEIDPVTAARTVFIQMDHYGYLQPADIPAEAIARARLLLVDSYDLDATERSLRAARAGTCQAMLDFESGDADRLRDLLSLGDHVILPLASAERLAEQSGPEPALHGLRKLTRGQLVVTDGVRGSWALHLDNQVHHQPAFRVRAIDTTGCGDAYHAGYAAGVLMNLPLHLRMELGALLASIVATQVGGRTALPWRNTLIQHLRDDVSPALRRAIEELAS